MHPHLANGQAHLINVYPHLTNVQAHLINVYPHLANVQAYLANVQAHLINVYGKLPIWEKNQPVEYYNICMVPLGRKGRCLARRGREGTPG